VARHYVNPRRPTTPRDLARALSDPQSAAALFGATADEWKDFEAEYARASGMDARLAEAEQMGAQKALRGGSGLPVGDAPRVTRKAYNARAIGARLDHLAPRGDRALASFAVGLNPLNESPGALQMRHELLNAAMSERVPAEGGFLVPEVLRADILELVLEQAQVRPRAMVVPMDSLRVPWPAIDDTSHSTSVYGGVTAYWTEEGAAITASAPGFARITLEAYKLAAYSQVPNELLADAGDLLEEWLRTQWPAAIAWFEDLAFITGNGVGEPQGFLNAPAAIRVPCQNTHAVAFLDIANCYQRMLPMSLPRAVWFCSPDVIGQLLTLAVTTSSTTLAPPGWLESFQAMGPPGGRTDGQHYRLLGHPLLVTEKMPACASTNTTTPGALTFIDPGMYLLGDRQSLQLAVSSEFSFSSDLTDYRLIERCSGRIWPQSALTPYNAGPTLSPVVKLDTTATS
jgi:HK97 family phage major capsid protein